MWKKIGAGLCDQVQKLSQAKNILLLANTIHARWVFFDTEKTSLLVKSQS
jgi:hypothetical protein